MRELAWLITIIIVFAVYVSMFGLIFKSWHDGHRIGQTWMDGDVAFGAALMIGIMTAVILFLLSAMPFDVRDPRCDRAARYQAMSEGVDCSVRF